MTTGESLAPAVILLRRHGYTSSDESLFFYYVCKCLMIRCDESEYQSVFSIPIDSRAKWKQDTCWNDFSRAFLEGGCPSEDGSLALNAIDRQSRCSQLREHWRIGKFQDIFEVCHVWWQTRRLLLADIKTSLLLTFEWKLGIALVCSTSHSICPPWRVTQRDLELFLLT